MAGVGVAVIDSGVHPGHPHVERVTAGRCFVPGLAVEDYRDALGHGTAVAGAIRERAPMAELYVARVFHRRLVTSIEILLAALDWALEQPVLLVNLSLATANPAHEAAFLERVERAAVLGIRIVSPAEGLPGRLPGVVGVRMDDSVDPYQMGPGYTACGWPRPIPGLPRERNLHGVSFAVANVTGCLARDLAMPTWGGE